MTSISDPHRPGPVLPPDFRPANTALLLDFDGTLVDIAPSPDAVRVEDGLRETLIALRDMCGGALAIVTGRPIEQIDHFLPGVPTAVFGEHGVAMRRLPGASIVRAPLPGLPAAWGKAAEDAIAQWPGSALERKALGLVLHYRGNPAAEVPLRAAAEGWLAGQGDFVLHPSKMAWEIRPAGIDKGHAVDAVMQEAPFAGRRPVFVGDDVTDEDGIRAAKAMGGTGFRIPDDFATSHAFRQWLGALAGGAQWGA